MHPVHVVTVCVCLGGGGGLPACLSVHLLQGKLRQQITACSVTTLADTEREREREREKFVTYFVHLLLFMTTGVAKVVESIVIF